MCVCVHAHIQILAILAEWISQFQVPIHGTPIPYARQTGRTRDAGLCIACHYECGQAHSHVQLGCVVKSLHTVVIHLMLCWVNLSPKYQNYG